MKKLLGLLWLIPCLVFGQTNNYNIADRGFAHNYIVDIAAGLVPNVSLMTVFGYSPATPSVTNVNLWALQTAWVPLTAATTMELLSSSAADASAGTGCRSVFVQGLDNNYNQLSESVVPNGVSVVALANSYIVINSATCLVNGSGNVNAGNITIRVSGGGSAQGYIAAGFGGSQQGRFTVPAGYTLVLENFFILSNKTASPSASASVLATFVLPGGTLINGLPVTVPSSNSVSITVPTSVVVASKQTLEFLIVSVSTTGLDISIGSSGILFKNP